MIPSENLIGAQIKGIEKRLYNSFGYNSLVSFDLEYIYT